jgi:hypothetical protein
MISSPPEQIYTVGTFTMFVGWFLRLISRLVLFCCERKTLQIGTFGFCGREEESTYHVLTQCTFAVRFWENLKQLTGIKIPRLNQGPGISWTMLTVSLKTVR